MLNIKNLKISDIEYLEDLISSSKKYIIGKAPVVEVVNVGNYICDISIKYWKYEDPKLLELKGIWSEIDDIKYEIKTGKPSIDIKDELDTEKDLEEYIESCKPAIQNLCKKLIKEYQPVLKALKKKYPKDYKQSDIFYIEELIDVTSCYLNKKIDNYTIISEIDWLYSELKEYGDQKLLIFANMWSEIIEIKSKKERGNKFKEDLQQYLNSKSSIISEMCQEIIEEYQLVLRELKKKYTIGDNVTKKRVERCN